MNAKRGINAEYMGTAKMSGVSAFSPPTPAISALHSNPKSTSALPPPLNLKLKGLRFRAQKWPSRPLNSRCNSSSGPGGPASGDEDSRLVLDAFFLGKAVAEALTERVESAVGEFFSTVGQLQAEQLKQVQEFQEDVLERAKRAKEKAAREAMEAQELIPKATATSDPDGSISATSPVTTNSPSTSPDTTEDPTRDVFQV